MASTRHIVEMTGRNLRSGRRQRWKRDFATRAEAERYASDALDPLGHGPVLDFLGETGANVKVRTVSVAATLGAL